MNTKHNFNCERVFKNYDKKCPRCIELMNGSKPRDGWQKKYFEAQEKLIQAIRAHNCVERNCGPVCTTFEW